MACYYQDILGKLLSKFIAYYAYFTGGGGERGHILESFISRLQLCVVEMLLFG